MKLYAVHGFFESSKHPKSLQPVCDLMHKALHKAFLNHNELEIFMAVLRRQLKDCMSEKGSAKLELFVSADKSDCSIHLHAHAYDQDSVCRLYISTITAVLEYNDEAADFFDVSEQLMKKGGVS